MGVGVAVGAVTLGASVIEKHFTLSRADGGVDSSFSLDPAEMKSLVEEKKRVWQSIGSLNMEQENQKKKFLIFRRSLYVA